MCLLNEIYLIKNKIKYQIFSNRFLLNFESIFDFVNQ